MNFPLKMCQSAKKLIESPPENSKMKLNSVKFKSPPNSERLTSVKQCHLLSSLNENCVNDVTNLKEVALRKIVGSDTSVDGFKANIDKENSSTKENLNVNESNEKILEHRKNLSPMRERKLILNSEENYNEDRYKGTHKKISKKENYSVKSTGRKKIKIKDKEDMDTEKKRVKEENELQRMFKRMQERKLNKENSENYIKIESRKLVNIERKLSIEDRNESIKNLNPGSNQNKENLSERKSTERKLKDEEENIEEKTVVSTEKNKKGRKLINVKERVKKYNERIKKEKENANERISKEKEKYSFNSIKNYLIRDPNSKENFKDSSHQTSFSTNSSRNRNPKFGCSGKEAPKGCFEDGFDLTKLSSQKISSLKRNFEPRIASPGKRKLQIDANEKLGSGKRTRK